MRRGSNPCFENCNHLSRNDLEKINNCELAFWECVADAGCLSLTFDDPEFRRLVLNWSVLSKATQYSIIKLMDAD